MNLAKIYKITSMFLIAVMEHAITNILLGCPKCVLKPRKMAYFLIHYVQTNIIYFPLKFLVIKQSTTGYGWIHLADPYAVYFLVKLYLHDRLYICIHAGIAYNYYQKLAICMT